MTQETCEMSVPAAALRFMQRRVANACVGASALRGSKEGTIEAVRSFFREVDLHSFRDLSLEQFDGLHTGLVKALSSNLKGKALSAEYGRCVKAVNLFLRDATCHHHLREAYRLDRIEPLLHIPVDEKVAYDLRRLSKPRALPRWRGVKSLVEADYQKYQGRAQEIADERQILRVFLDDEFWSRPKSDRPTKKGPHQGNHAARLVSP